MDNKVENIINDLNNKIDYINKVINQHSLTDLTKEIINLKERDSILNNLLNYYLEKIKPIYKKEILDNKYYKITEITDYFIEDNEDDLIIEDGNTIVYDFLEKLNSNDNRLTLPIDIKYIKEYSINNNIDKDDVTKEIIWMIILLATIYYCIKEKAN